MVVVGVGVVGRWRKEWIGHGTTVLPAVSRTGLRWFHTWNWSLMELQWKCQWVLCKPCWGMEAASWIQGGGSKQRRRLKPGGTRVCHEKSQKRKDRKETWRPCMGHLLWPLGGQATQRRKLDLEVDLDHKLQRISRIKLNEDIQTSEDIYKAVFQSHDFSQR